MNRHTESIKHKSLILLCDLFALWGFEIHLIFMHSWLSGLVQQNLVPVQGVGIAESTNTFWAVLCCPSPSTAASAQWGSGDKAALGQGLRLVNNFSVSFPILKEKKNLVAWDNTEKAFWNVCFGKTSCDWINHLIPHKFLVYFPGILNHSVEINLSSLFAKHPFQVHVWYLTYQGF